MGLKLNDYFMNTKFFNNQDSPLFDKFKGIAQNMHDFHTFLAVSGFFRSSGYFKLRKELVDAKEIKILVGINIDNIFRKHDKSLLMLEGEDEAKEIYTNEFIQDVLDAKYSAEVEDGIRQLCDDLANGVVEMRIDKSKNLHAKFYLCLPEEHNENSDGWVIMGSSNISDSGLGITQPPRYELNVAMKGYDDVCYCKEEFWKLWKESIPLSPEDIARIRKKTHLDNLPTPYELYIKVLIDAFGDQVEDNFTMKLPDNYKELKYQTDAVIQGYQMLKEYNGFFLSDVVGTGKTVVGAMIAKRFIEENGKDTKVLVIYPPAVKDNWLDTFKDFGIKDRYTQFISNGSLDKVLEGKDNYLTAEQFDLILVDEAHNFRSDAAERYNELQLICKTPRFNDGLVDGTRKKVMLLTATPLNNRPDDFLNLILLFQDANNPTIDGVGNLNIKFQPWIKKYKEAMSMRYTAQDSKELSATVEQIYFEMRTQILDKIIVRRTRKNLVNNPEYKEDLDTQGIIFPHIEQPTECIYNMDPDLSQLFYDTITLLTDTKSEDNPKGIGFDFARYRAIEFLTGEAKKKYKQAEHITELLSAIYRVHMVKRLESSFYAFRKSLHTFLRITQDMIKMFEEDKVLIAPDYDVKGMMAKDMELDEVIEAIAAKGVDKEDFVYQASDFEPQFLDMLKSDEQKLQELCKLWDADYIKDKDPKLDKFISLLKGELFNKKRNKEGKLVVFSESVDTLNYLKDELEKRLKRNDILFVSASNRKTQLSHIQQNFDANYKKGDKLNNYNIILTSDVLAEGVNLHRSNIIVNYDSPWNATRLMQRIGRVNRIGSVAEHVYNYMFYPSQEGDNQIKLYDNALLKLQGFHSALGEDAQIYSRQEILHDFKLFDENVRDNIDKQLELLREIRELYANDKDLYKRIKSLPAKSRSVRQPGIASQKEVEHKTSVIYITKGQKSQFYIVEGDNGPKKLEFVEAAEILRAKVEEPSGDFKAVEAYHYPQVERAYRAYLEEVEDDNKQPSLKQKQTDNGTKAMAAMRGLKRAFRNEDDIYQKLVVLERYIADGVFNRLTKSINTLQKSINSMTKNGSKVTDHANEIFPVIESLYDKYYIPIDRLKKDEDDSTPLIITSETFM